MRRAHKIIISETLTRPGNPSAFWEKKERHVISSWRWLLLSLEGERFQTLRSVRPITFYDIPIGQIDLWQARERIAGPLAAEFMKYSCQSVSVLKMCRMHIKRGEVKCKSGVKHFTLQSHSSVSSYTVPRPWESNGFCCCQILAKVYKYGLRIRLTLDSCPSEISNH